MAAHSLNHVREEDMPESIGPRTLRAACEALRQVELSPVLAAYVAEASAIESLRTADEVSLNVAIIVVMAWNAYERINGQGPANDADTSPQS